MKKFTLLELLIVIAIITEKCLCTILLPSHYARQKPKWPSVLGKNKQIVFLANGHEKFKLQFFDYLEDNQIWTGHLKDYIMRMQ